MISPYKRRIMLSLDTNTIDILEYNAGAMACTKSELIIMYLQSIGMAGSVSEKKFNATILEDKYK